MSFIAKNLSTVLISAVILSYVIWVVKGIVKNKKKGKGMCGCGCTECPSDIICNKD